MVRALCALSSLSDNSQSHVCYSLHVSVMLAASPMLHTLHPSPPSLYSRWAPLESVLGYSTSGSPLVYMYRLLSVLQ